MSDDPILLQYVKSIDERTARMESSINTTLQIHQEGDDVRHKEIDTRLKSLETSRTAARAGMAALVMGGTGGAAKLGFFEKILSMIGGAS